jgi:hypothetical protein
MEKIKIRRRIPGTLTVAQQRRLAKARKLIAAELPELVRRNQMRHNARKEKTFSGMLRRAVHTFPLSPMKIAERGDIPWTDFSRFLTGENTLPSDAIDRLVKVLKLRLPTSKGRGTAKAS